MRRAVQSKRAAEAAFSEPVIVRRGDPGADGSVDFCLIVDISPTGLQFISDYPYSLGDEVEVSIAFQGRPGTCSLRGTVNLVTRAADGIFNIVGVEANGHPGDHGWRRQFH